MTEQINELDDWQARHQEMMVKIDAWKETWDGKVESMPDWVHAYGQECIRRAIASTRHTLSLIEDPIEN
jgi:hypothetical protein